MNAINSLPHNEIFNTMRRYLENRATHIRVQTDLGTGVKVTKKEALTMLDTLERRGVVPTFSCTEIIPNSMKYMIIIDSSVASGGIFIN